MAACALVRFMDPRDDQRAWLLDVLKRTKLAPTALAIRAHLAPTTLTRFLNNPEHASALSARTISAVERIAGVRFHGGDAVAAAKPGPSEAEPFMISHSMGGAVAKMIDAALAQEGMSAFELHSRALEGAGYLPGDVLVVDVNATPTQGDIVAVSVRDWSNQEAAFAFRLYEPPALLAATMDASMRRPMFLDKQHQVSGVVVVSLRPGRREGGSIHGRNVTLLHG